MEKIHRGIVITTSEHTKDWLAECVKSVGTNYNVTVHVNTPLNNGFELAGIQTGKDTYDEFIHLMDTTIIKDTSLFDKLFEIEGHVFLTEGGYHYMGKFVSKDLPAIPKINNKGDAISLELRWLGKEPRTYFEPDLPVHTNVFEDKNGQRRMRLENDYLIKYKATWSL